jgi:site-specific DNA recombinase
VRHALAIDEAVMSSLEQHVFTPERLRILLAEMIAANQNDAEAMAIKIENRRLKDALSRVESGIRALFKSAAAHGDAFNMNDPILRQELADLKVQRASLLGQTEASEARQAVQVSELTEERIVAFAIGAREKLRSGDPSFRRTWLRHFVSEVILGQQDITLRVRQEAVAACSTGVPSFARDWRTRQDSNL